MIVCICKNIPERAIYRLVEEGVDNFDELQFELGVSTCCGKCEPFAREVLRDACRSCTRACGELQAA